jgi:hypothetical protein
MDVAKVDVAYPDHIGWNLPQIGSWPQPPSCSLAATCKAAVASLLHCAPEALGALHWPTQQDRDTVLDVVELDDSKGLVEWKLASDRFVAARSPEPSCSAKQVGKRSAYTDDWACTNTLMDSNMAALYAVRLMRVQTGHAQLHAASRI